MKLMKPKIDHPTLVIILLAIVVAVQALMITNQDKRLDAAKQESIHTRTKLADVTRRLMIVEDLAKKYCPGR